MKSRPEAEGSSTLRSGAEAQLGASAQREPLPAFPPLRLPDVPLPVPLPVVPLPVVPLPLPLLEVPVPEVPVPVEPLPVVPMLLSVPIPLP